MDDQHESGQRLDYFIPGPFALLSESVGTGKQLSAIKAMFRRKVRSAPGSFG